MREFTIQTELWLPRPRHEVFPFIAEVRNLETLTPPERVVQQAEVRTAALQRVCYARRKAGMLELNRGGEIKIGLEELGALRIAWSSDESMVVHCARAHYAAGAGG